MRSFLAVVCFVVASLGAASSHADSRQARDLAARATIRAQEGNLRGAIELLERAHEADPSPDYLLQLADQYDVLARTDGDRRDLHLAINELREYLATERNSLEIQSVQARIKGLQERLEHWVPPPAKPFAPLPQPERAAVDIEFATTDLDEPPVHVAVGNASCVTPCLLKLVPGNHSMVLNSDDRKVLLRVPHAPAVVRLPTYPRRYLVTGVVLTVLGTLIGGSLWAASNGCTTDRANGFGCVISNLVVWPIAGATLFFTGIGYLGYYGTHQISKVDFEQPEDAAPPRLSLANIGFQPMRNGGGAGAGFSF